MQSISQQSQPCLVCLQVKPHPHILPECKHTFCKQCLIGYISTLRKYNLLTPEKLTCLSQSCVHPLPDSLIHSLFPSEQGFILTMIRKHYLESKDPSILIFNCKGFTKLNRQPLVDKPSTMDRLTHSKLMNQKIRRVLQGTQVLPQGDKKICTNIVSYNKFSNKQKNIQCYVCGVTYCTQCNQLGHDGKNCEIKEKEMEVGGQLGKYSKKRSQTVVQDTNQQMEAYLNANSMTKCPNPKCGLAIAKEEGCFFVKCRCSWQFCYPCKVVWGDCQHFSKYPYKKFTPPPQWMVKALNLY